MIISFQSPFWTPWDQKLSFGYPSLLADQWSHYTVVKLCNFGPLCKILCPIHKTVYQRDNSSDPVVEQFSGFRIIPASNSSLTGTVGGQTGPWTLGVVKMYFFQNLNICQGGCHYTTNFKIFLPKQINSSCPTAIAQLDLKIVKKSWKIAP